MSYSDTAYKNNNLTYTTTVITGDNDKLLEPGELLEVNIALAQDSNIALVANETFAIEIKPPQGSYLVIQRTIPASINQSILNLN
jgi:archaellin